MQRIIIFRFHKFPLICANRLKLLKKLNPEIRIFGIYGGGDKDLPKFRRCLNKYLENIFIIKNRSISWKWKNFDLALRYWFRKIGKNIDFDTAHIVEWDLILCESLEKMYSEIDKNELGLTGLIDLRAVEKKWYWTSKEPSKSEWLKLLNFVKRKYTYSNRPKGSLGPGLCLPKKFIEEYSKAKIPELCNDELRIPLFAQVFRFKCKDTKFYKKWFNDEEKKYFNCIGRDIDIQIIKKERKNNGRKAFHPFRKIFNEV